MKVKLLLLLCVTAAVYCSTERLFKPQLLAQRTDSLRNRLLQATGYSAGTDPDEKKYCDDAGIEFDSDLVLPDEDLQAISLNMDSKFKSVKTELLDLIKGGTFNAGYPAKATKIVTKLPLIVLSIIGAALIVLFLIFAIVYGLVKCLCGAAKKDDEKERNKEEKEKSYKQKQDNKENQQNQGHHPNSQDDKDRQNQNKQQDHEIPQEDKNPSNPDQQYQNQQQDRQKSDQKQQEQQKSDQKDDKKEENKDSDEEKKKQELQDAVKVQNRWKYASYGLCVAAFALTIIWFVYLAVAVGKVKNIVCAAAGFKRIAVRGDLKGDDFKFAGVNGLTFLAQKALDNVGSFPAASVSAQLTNINSKNFATESAQVLSDFNGLKQPESRYAYTGLDGSSKVVPPSVQEYVRKLYPVDLKFEASTVTGLAAGLGAAATVFAKSPQVTSDSLNAFKTALDVALKIPAEKFFQMVSGGTPDYMSGIKRLGLVVLILGGILIFVALIIVGLVLYHVSKLLAAFSGDNQNENNQEEQKRKDEERKKEDEEQKKQQEQKQRQEEEQRRQDEQNRNSNNGQQNSDQRQNQASQPQQNQDQQEQDRLKGEPSHQQQNNQNNHNNQNNQQQPQNSETQRDNSNTNKNQNDNNNSSNKDNNKGGCLQKLLSLTGAKVVQLVVALVLIVLSLAIFIYAIAAVFGSVAFSTACSVSHKVLYEGQFVTELSASGYLTPQASALLKECISSAGSGDIKNVLGSSLPSDLIAMIDAGGSVAAYGSFKTKNTGATPQVSTAFSTKISDLVLLKKSDSDSSPNDVEAGRASINKNKCSSDTAGYNDGVCASSAPSDADNTGLGTAFCFNFNSFQAAGYPTRYQTGVTCTGNTDAPTGQQVLTSTLKAAASYKTSMTTLQTDFNVYYQGTGGAKGIKQLYADVKAVDADVTALSGNAAIKALVDSQAGFNGGLQSSGNCTLLRKGIIATHVAVCDKVFKPFYTQMGLSFANACALLGAGIALLGSCYYTSKVEILIS